MQIVDLSDFLVVALASTGVFVMAGAVQAVTGFGLALAAVPVLSMFLETGSVVAGTVGCGAVVTSLAWWRERQHVDVVVARRLSTTALAGMPLGFVAIVLLPEDGLTLVVCLVVLVLVVALARDLRPPSGRRAQRAAGVASGALLTSTSMNGPPLVLVLHGARLAPRTFRATLQAVFCLQGSIAVVGFVALGRVDAVAGAVMLGGGCGIWPGWRLGDRLFRQMSAEVFGRVVLVGLALTAVVSLATLAL